MADVYGYGKIGVVHFDAHADTAPDMQGVLAGHGTPMRRLIESGAVLGRNFVQVGLRGYWPGPDVVAWMEEQEMHSHFMAEVQRHGFDTVLERAINEALSGGADHLYISVDVDAVDPAHAPGTGSPEPGGLTSADVLRAVRRMCAEVGMVAMDVVEVSPPYDSGNNITALFAHRCVLEALTGTAMRRLGLTTPDYLDETSAGGPSACERTGVGGMSTDVLGYTEDERRCHWLAHPGRALHRRGGSRVRARPRLRPLLVDRRRRRGVGERQAPTSPRRCSRCHWRSCATRRAPSGPSTTSAAIGASRSWRDAGPWVVS